MDTLSDTLRMLDERFSHTPENGNYLLVGARGWAHGEKLEEAVRNYLREFDILPGSGNHTEGARSFVLLDVSDDFRIGNISGEVSAKKVRKVCEITYTYTLTQIELSGD